VPKPAKRDECATLLLDDVHSPLDHSGGSRVNSSATCQHHQALWRQAMSSIGVGKARPRAACSEPRGSHQFLTPAGLQLCRPCGSCTK
jgi:hypothetical protein